MIGKVFDRIGSIRETATKKELILIDKLQTVDRTELIYMSITDLAEKVGIAEATILRFCRKLEYKGFQDFKLNLSQDLAVEPTNHIDDNAKNNLDNICDALSQTYEQLEYEKCLELADKIIKARKVCFFGVGNSSIATQAAKIRLIRVGINIENSIDNHVQTIVTSNLNEEDVIVLISVSGCTKDIIAVAATARKNGSKIAIITNYSKSPLAKYADYLLISSKKEAPYEGGTLASVISQLYIIDMLNMAIFELLGHESIKRSVKSSMDVSDKSI